MLNELLPTSAGDQCTQLVLDKQSYLVDHSDLLQKFGMDILPMLVQVCFLTFTNPMLLVVLPGFLICSLPFAQVVNSGANIYVCYGCLSVIHKIVYLSKSDMLVELLKSANMPR